MTAVALADRARHPGLIRKLSETVDSEGRFEKYLGVDSLGDDLTACHPGYDFRKVMGGVATRSDQFIGGAEVTVALGQDGGGHLSHVAQVHHRLIAIERPGEAENALRKGGLEPVVEHVVGGLEDGE